MKNLKTSVLAPLTLVSAAFFAGSFSVGAAPTQDAEGQDLAARVDALEKRIATLENTKDSASARLDDTIAYLAGQADASKGLEASIAEAERLGFTKGINYESREVLANGLRAYCAAQQKGLPDVASTPKGASDKPKNVARGR